MIIPTKHQLNIFVNLIHSKIFGQPMGKEMQKFIQNLGWVGTGTVIGIILTFVVNIFAGRLLGPIEYGKYSLIISLGQILIIPMTMGFNTSVVKHISSSTNTKEKKLFAQNAISLSLISVTATSILFLILHSQISALFKIDNQLLIFLYIYTLLLAFKYMFEAITKGFHQFKLISFLEVLNAITIFTLFFLYILTIKNFTFSTYLIPTIAGLLFYSIFSLTKNKNKLTPFKFNRNIAKKIINYSKFVFLGSISGIAINNIDKLIINKYMTLTDVGTYSVYLSSSAFIGSYLLQIFIQVFFPTVSAIKERKSITNKIIKLILFTAVPITIFNICSTSLILFLMGNQYPRNAIYIILFSILGTITIFSSIFWWLVASHGRDGIKFTSITGSTLGIFNIIMMATLVQSWKIFGIITSLIITNLLMILFALYKINTHEKEQS